MASSKKSFHKTYLFKKIKLHSCQLAVQQNIYSAYFIDTIYLSVSFEAETETCGYNISIERLQCKCNITPEKVNQEIVLRQ